jgi:NAD+ synthase
MMTLYDLSVVENALVVGTSNKSEILLGYGTLFGDTACAINPVGELFKTEIFELASYLGVTEAILTKAPSADLWEGQTDEEELGYTYAQLDKVLRVFVEESLSEEDLVRRGFDEDLVRFSLKRYSDNLFKQSLPRVALL